MEWWAAGQAVFSSFSLQKTTSLQLHSRARLDWQTRHDPHTAGRPSPCPQPRAERSGLPGVRLARTLTSSISKSRMLGAEGGRDPQLAALSIRSSHHLVATATAAMVNRPSATEPGSCRNLTGEASVLPAWRWGEATMSE